MDLRTVIFVPALVGCVVFGFLFALFASHYYLNVLQSTASGARQVVWISEPILDSFWKVFYMGWMIVFWLGPAWFLGRAFASGPDHSWLRYAVPLSVFWICYPLSQLSSLSGPTIWLPIHHDVFGRLARKPQLIPGFLAISGLVLAALGLGFHLTFHANGLEYLFIGAPLFVAAVLFYSRVLGRIAYALMFTRSILSRKKKKKPREDREATPSQSTTEETSHSSPVTDYEAVVEVDADFVQPSELPPIQTPDEGALHGYNVSFADERPKPRKRVRAESVGGDLKDGKKPTEPVSNSTRPSQDAEEDEAISYGVREAEVAPEDRAPPEVVKPSEVEMRLLNRDDAPKPIKKVWTAEVFGFLLQPDSIAVLGLLTLLCVLVGGMVRIARAFNPASEGS